MDDKKVKGNAHWRNYYARNKARLLALTVNRKRELERNGRCITCGLELMEEEGKKCMNCYYVAHHSGITQGGY